MTMQIPLIKRLHEEGHISGDTLKRAAELETAGVFSIYWELRVLLYLGVLLLTGGLGILVYKNIDSIGHAAVLAGIGCMTAGCFAWCLLKKAPFRWDFVGSPDALFDYLLLLGCLCLLIFLGYWQFEYQVFGTHFGLAAFIPMTILFASAYLFDHRGVLSLAITNLAAWAGIAITPLSLLRSGAFSEDRLIYTGVLLGAVLLLAGRLSRVRGWKAHFELTWSNFGLHLLFVSLLAGLFRFDRIYLLWFLGLLAVAGFLFIQARAQRSFYFIVAIVGYSYIGFSDVVLRNLPTVEAGLYLGFLYFMISGIGLAVWLIRINRQLKRNDCL